MAAKGSKGRRPPARRTSPGSAGAGPAPTKATRAERLEAARRARQRKAAMVRAGVTAAVAVLALVVAVVVLDNRGGDGADRAKLTAGSCTVDRKSDRTDPSPANHVPPASYEVDPPAGGDHSPQVAAAGVYGEGRPAPPDPEIVHALEHGYVVVWHRPGLSETELTAVEGVADRYPDDVLVVPRASLKAKAAATAWGRRLLCSEVEAPRLAEFVRQYRNRGPEKIPHT